MRAAQENFERMLEVTGQTVEHHKERMHAAFEKHRAMFEKDCVGYFSGAAKREMGQIRNLKKVSTGNSRVKKTKK